MSDASDHKKGAEVGHSSEVASYAGHDHVSEPLIRQFGLMPLLGVGLLGAGYWAGQIVTMVTVLSVGGPPGLFWGIFVCAFCILCIAISLAELASAYPTAGGVLDWAYEGSSKSSRKFVAWTTAWLNTFAWIVTATTWASLVAQQVLALAVLYHPDYVIKQWHTWLLLQAVLIVGLLVNLFAVKIMPALDKIGLVTFFTGCIVLSITVVATAPSHQSARFVFVDIINSTGWSSNGLVWCLGQIATSGAFILIDSPSHLSEETIEPEKNVPKAMVYSVLIGTVTGLFVTLCFMFSIVDVDGVLTSATGVPYIQIIRNATQSNGATVVLSLFMIILSMYGAVTSVTVASRVSWAFARDGGLLFPKTFSKMSTSLHVPVQSLLLCVLISSCVGVIYLGSITAFNSFLAALTILFFACYAMVIGSFMLNGRYIEKRGPYKLSSTVGWTVNVIAMVYMIFFGVIFCFPFVYPPTANTMNWSSVILVGVVLLSSVGYVTWGRNSYAGPSGAVMAERIGQSAAATA
ncbi:Amino acid/polyamine transporter I [Kalmanozyma brasiliensis GHG001]|uniref:Amino acid transporter n=1 Tax=Kalmanozyma brasiliensis (strain GHG001) TaxID=1365824 RepID=V5GRP5_KALBG|nr:Amino acid/polyamine transporter I [Kalmanozyma brasiliensis GHG001]EST08577.1 Amino acid/polyamine transporter I [Kalmanozyma brasiliensis GHG001]